MSADARRERRARALATDTTPGKVLAFALLANGPIAAGFVLAPLFARGDPQAGLAFVPWALVLTPLFAIASFVVLMRAPRERRQHRAARMGALLAGTALFLWLGLVAIALLR